MTLTGVLRKYGNTLLMVFMALLLIAFLLPTNMFRDGGGPNSFKLGTLNGEDVMSGDVRAAMSSLEIAKRCHPTVGQFAAAVMRGSSEISLYLLYREAKEAGALLTGKTVKERGLVSDEAIYNAREHFRVSPERIYDCVGEWVGVMLYTQLAPSSTGLSLPRLEHGYRDTTQAAKLSCAALKAADLVSVVGEPTEEELVALFEEGKDRETSYTSEQPAFGFRQPPRVKVESLTVPFNAFSLDETVTTREAEKYFESNRQQYEANGVVPTFEQAKEMVKEDLRNQKAIDRAERLVNDLHRKATRPWTGAVATPDGFRMPIEEPIDFMTLKAGLPDADKVQVSPFPAWLDARMFGFVMRDLAGATYRSGQKDISALELAFRVQGLQKPDENTQDWLSLGEPSPVLTRAIDGRDSATRQAYFFRVTAVKPAGPPDSLDEVRREVVNAWKQTKAYALAQELAIELESKAKDVGLKQAVEELKPRVIALFAPADAAETQPTTQPTDRLLNRVLNALGPQEAQHFTRNQQYLPGVSVHELSDFAKEIFSTADVESLPVAERIHRAGFAGAGELACVVAEAEKIEPLKQDEFEAWRSMMGAIEVYRFSSGVMGVWLDPERIQIRTGWELPPRENESEPEAADAEAAG